MKEYYQLCKLVDHTLGAHFRMLYSSTRKKHRLEFTAFSFTIESDSLEQLLKDAMSLIRKYRSPVASPKYKKKYELRIPQEIREIKRRNKFALPDYFRE